MAASLYLTGAAIRTIHPEACPDIGPICNVRDEPPQLHDQKLTTGDLRLDLEYGFAAGWSIGAILGARVVDTRIQYTDLDGNPKELDYENIHHRNETLYSLSDPWLLIRRGFNLESLQIALSFRAGVTIPVGKVEQDPFLLGARGLPHQHTQFGTGTLSPVLGFDVRKDFRVPFNGSVDVYGLAIVTPYANGYGYRAGDRYSVGAALAGKIGISGPILRGGAMLLAETPEKWASTTHPTEGNLGRTDVLLDFGVVYTFVRDWSTSLVIRVPLFTQALNQLSYPAVGELGVNALLHTHEGKD